MDLTIWPCMRAEQGAGPVLPCPTDTADFCQRTCMLSGHAVGQLPLARQLVVWAVREHWRSSGRSKVLARGLRLALGEREAAPGLAALEGLMTALVDSARTPPAICCVRCALVSADEWALLELTAAAGQPGGDHGLGLAGLLVRPAHRLELATAARRLAMVLDRAGLPLPPSPDRLSACAAPPARLRACN